MRTVNFMLDYDGAKEIERERLRNPESRVGESPRICRIRRIPESQELADAQQPQDGIDVSAPLARDLRSLTPQNQFPPFSRQCLTKWDSEVVTEGTTHCSGWRKCSTFPPTNREGRAFGICTSNKKKKPVAQKAIAKRPRDRHDDGADQKSTRTHPRPIQIPQKPNYVLLSSLMSHVYICTFMFCILLSKRDYFRASRVACGTGIRWCRENKKSSSKR